MATSTTSRGLFSAKALTLSAHAAFVPIGIVTVLLSPLLPTLSTRWSLNYSQAGELFTAQFLASTGAVLLSGTLISRWGFRFAMKAGLLVIAVSVAGLLSGSRLLGMACIAGYGIGIGLSVPAANLVVSEVNPARRSAALNLLNFSWSAGAVACPFLVAAAARGHHITTFLILVAAASFLVAAAIALMPSSVVEPPLLRTAAGGSSADWKHRSFPVMAALFFLYVGTENSFGGWAASYANSLGSMTSTVAVMIPSFFYTALMLGRWLAPLLLRRIEDVRVAQVCLLLACAGMAGMVGSRSMPGVIASASVAGMGLSAVYPITISLLSREFGQAASRVGAWMFTSANLGGALLPWLVGAFSNRVGTLKVGLAVPLAAGAVMLALYRRKWPPISGQSFSGQSFSGQPSA
jgi:MFS transporter, FHS family, glucose/mannose:H+ symporter